MAKKNKKKNKETFLAVFRPAQHSLVITRRKLGSGSGEETDYRVIATDIPEVKDVQSFIHGALSLIREAGWTFPPKGSWTPRSVVRLHDQETEWVWEVRRTRSDIRIRMTGHDFQDMITGAADSAVADEPDRFVSAGPEYLDPELMTLYATRGRAEAILAREYLRSNGWQVVEVWDTAGTDPERPWIDPGPSLLTDRPWRPQVTEEDLKKELLHRDH